jgi:hypothetical protein
MPRWFCKKRFGYGWTPATWQGWLVTALFVGVCTSLASPHITGLAGRERLAAVLALVAGFIALIGFTSGRDSDR